MTGKLNRREFVERAALGALTLPLAARDGSATPIPPASQRGGKFHGIFAILETPFASNGTMEEEDLAREADFCVRAGTHGLVWPQLGAEFFLLTDDERMRGAEILIRATAHRRPVVIGVQAPYKETAIKLAHHAESKGADAVIAIPPFVGHASMDTVSDYYRSLANSVRLPIFLQNSGSPWGPALSPEFVIQQAKEFPHLGYIKEEVDPVPHRLEIYAQSGAMAGIFSGNAGRNLLNEMPRGSSGTMPACEFIDVNAQIYDLAAAGKMKEAFDLFEALLPLINLEETYGMVFAKSILVRRGIFKTAKMREGSATLDQYDERELDHWWAQIKPHFKV